MTTTANQPTLRDELLQRRLSGLAAGRRRRIPTADRSGDLPLSYGQQQMWFLNRMDTASAEFLVPSVLRLRGPLDAAALGRAWNAILARHEILRTRYALSGATASGASAAGRVPVQVIDPPRQVELPTVDLRALPRAERDARAAELTAGTAETGFDLAQEWPVRATLLRLADAEHLFVTAMHHIACDAPALEVLLGELAVLYRAFAAGQDSPLAPPALHFADFASWQREQLRGDGLRRHVDYWRNQLAGVTPLELPADRPRPRVRDWRGAALPFELGPELSAAVRRLAQGTGTTLFVTLMAAFQALLARYTGRGDIPVGSVSSARRRPELQRLVGYGIDNLVIRGRWEGDPAFVDLLDGVRSTVLDAFDHADAPFALLVDELEPERDMSRTPLYQVAFTLRGDAAGATEWPAGLTAEPLWPPVRSSKVDLTLHAVDGADGLLRGQVEYATALFDPETVQRLVDHFTRLLTHVAADPGARLSQLDILDPAELAAVTPAPALPAGPVAGTVHGAFAAVAARTPAAPAVTYGGGSLTYAELDAAANRLANHLRTLGAGPEALVGVCLDRGPQLVPSLLGVLKAGAGYLPLDPGSPAERIDFMLADAGVRLVVTTEAHRERFAAFGGTVVVLDDPEIAAAPDSEPDAGAGPDNVAYVIYTSGSTGRPKGVCVTHAHVLRLMAVTEDDYRFGPEDVWPLFHSYAFDFSVWELWGALLYGGRLVVVPTEIARSPELFLDLLVAEGVTVLNQTPSAFRRLVRLAADGDPRVDRLALRAVIFGGERLEYGDLAPWVARRDLDRTRLLNMYGITETTVHVTYHRVVAADLERPWASPVGHPLADLSVHLLDASGRPVPIGVPGEIHVGGPGVARGYLGRPELTAERFVPDPCGPPGSRLYRSGDVARRRPDGSLEFVGRIDDQVKIRGYRIELGEVEAAMAALPGVRDVVVVVREDTPGHKRLVAYSVLVDGAPMLRPAQVRAALARTLPDYMIPSAFVPVARIPLTTNGKLDKKALPSPDRGVTSTDRPYVPPRSTVEERLAEVWTGVLGLSRVSVEDSFFDVGGDSIRAVGLAGALRTAGFDVEVRDIFEHRSIAHLAQWLTGRPAPAEPVAAVAPFALITDADRALVPDGVVDAYPCSQAQLGMLAELLADSDRNHYHNVTTYRIPDRGEFSLDAFRAAAALLVERHEVLRTSFDLDRFSVPMQLVHATAEMPVSMDLAVATERAALEAELRAYIASERRNLFDLGQPSLFRLHARVNPDGSWWLTLTECHPILDGWSYHSLIMEVLADYHRIRDGLPADPRPLPPVRFADAVAAELRSTGDGVDGAYWRRALAGHERFALPEAWGYPTADAADQHERWVPLQDLEADLRALARTVGVPLKSVLLAAHLKVMSQLTRERRFFTGLVCNIRPEVAGADRVYGMHLNTMPLPHDAGRDRTWRELIRETFARELELWPHRRYPLPVLQREIGDGSRMLDVRFSYHDFHQIDTAEVDYADSIDDSPTEFPMGVICRLGFVTLQASRRHVTAEHLARMGGMYRLVLDAMVADPDGDARVACLPEPDGPVVLADADPVHEPVERSVLAEFEARAARTPSAEAVNGTGFAELDARAGGVATALRARGVTGGSVVGVLLDRGVDLVAALLGVWKAGAAYLPIDPSHPAGRIAPMLADGGVTTVVTSGRYADRFDGVDVLRVEDSPVRGAVSTVTDLDALAYVIFTSGSTGRPKGVQVTHRGLANHVRWAARTLAGRGTGGSAVFSSVAFDLQVPNLWAPLAAGQRVFMVDQDLDLAELGPALAAAGPFSFLKMTPGHLEIVGGQLPDEALAALAPVVVVAGEALPAALANRWLDLLGRGNLINEYGPTEASVGTCVQPIDGVQDSAVVPIGRALPGMTMFVLDAGLRPAPVGVVGELYVGGVGVARGYAGAPELTAAKFVPDPFGPPGARLYRTGDLAYRRPDGAVQFCGRTDDQVKIRGFRIELGEIEAALSALPGVRDAAVLVREEAGGDKRLAGYWAGTAQRPDEVRAALARTLPDHLIPADLVRVDAIPLNANGKVDRKALLALAIPDERVHVAPATDLEHRLAGIWSRILERDQIGTHDSFFDLGGHSISAIALVGALRGAGFAVGVKDVFQHRTVAALAAHIEERDAAAAEPAFRPVTPFALISAADRALVPAGVVDAYPCGQVQLGMLVMTMADQERRTYHNVSAFPIRDAHAFSPDVLRRAVRVVVERHEILRTSFALDGFSVPMQLVHAEVPVEVTVLDGHTEDALRAYMAAERSRPFPPDQAPQMRVAAMVGDDGTWWFVLTMSHGILEGWSHHSLLMEILDNYRAVRDTGGPAPFAPLPVRYADFVAGELEALESAADQDYWRRVAALPRFELPGGWGEDESVPEYQCGTRVPMHDLMDGLRDLAAGTGTSLKSVLLAAHLKVMSQLTREPVFTSGLVCHGRPEVTGADRVYGMHLNTLPFAHDTRRAGTWRELIRQTFAGELELWPHRRYPVPAVQRLAGGQRPLEILFNYLDFQQIDTERVGVEDAIYEATGEFDLHVSTLDGTLSILARSHVVDYPGVVRIGAMYRAVLEAMVADADGDARVSRLPADEIPPAPAEPEPVPRSVLDEVEARVAETPHAEAVDGLSFADLDARAAAVAGVLRSRGVGAGSVVGVLLDRGADLVVTLLGVWKAGAAYLPLDPSYPAGRLAVMLADAGVTWVVTSDRYAGRFTVDTLLVADFAGADASPVERSTDLDELAYVIFTSGSTGRPKGVQVTHRGLANHIRWAARTLAGRGTGGSAVFSSVAFDLQVPNLWAPLAAGQRVVMVDQDLDLAELGPALAAAGPFSFLKMTPAHLEIVGRGLPTEALAALAPVVVVAGEALPAAVANRWLGILGPGNLVNEYGPTEASVGTCVHPVLGEQTRPVVPIGKALPGMTMHVLDANLSHAPAGMTGELYVGGTGVARGYLGAAELTAAKFVPDPFGPPGARLYRTGDLARRLPDGAVEFCGRIDDQIKVRGYRIELGEIEAAMTALPGVDEAAVLVREEANGDKRLAAYWTGTGQRADGLRAALAGVLPDYMIPADLVPVDALPLNANGKVDRKALLALAVPRERVHVAPATDLQRRLAGIWAKVLKLEEVSVADSFFDLGGDSLRAVVLVGALRAAKFAVGVKDVFRHRTVAALAAHIEAQDAAAAEPAFTAVAPFALISAADRALVPAGAVDAYPAVQAQIGMAVEIQKDPERSLYHIVRSFRVNSGRPFSADALRAAVRETVARHETLRTSFHLTGYSVPMQVVHADATAEVRVSTLDGDVEARLRAYVDAERAAPFDIEHPPPLFRVAAHVSDDRGWWLTVAVSHLVTGGWDLNTLLPELLGAYERRCAGLPPESTEPVAVRYADFVAAELESLRSEVDAGYWREVTAGYPAFAVPEGWGEPDRARQALRVRVSYQDLEERLRAFASASEVSPKAVLHAAHLKVMSQLSREDRFHTGLVCDARPEVRGAERVHGMYINILPFAYERGAASWRELVKSVFDREVELWPHRRYPLAAVRRLAGAGSRPIDVVFDYTEFRRAAQDGEEAADYEAVAGEGGTEFGLQVTAAGGFLDLVSDRAAFGSAALARLGGMFRRVLEAMVDDPDGDARAAYLPAGEREAVLGGSTGGGAPAELAHEAFQRRAAARPSAVAVTSDGRSVSYGELNESANRLAHHLRDLGVGPEVLVGVHADRSVEQIVAMLAVHKAGGVYLPLDPGYPADRLAFMLADAGAPVLLTAVDGLPPSAARVVRLDEPGAWADRPVSDPAPLAGPDSGCYAIYTSGSTGRPKGVLVPHGALANRLAYAAPHINRLDERAAILQKTAIGFDVSPGEVYAALSAGARVVVARPGGHRDPAYLRDLIVTESVTAVELVPSMLSALLREGLDGCVSLRSVAVGGEEIPADVARAFLAALPECELHNTYGPAEATIDVTSWLVTADRLAGLSRVPIGAAFPGVVLRVLDGDLQPVAPGVGGELFIGGAALARGYLGAAALTAERFLPDPYGPPGARLYRTGDAAAWRPDGTVDFLGRIDSQVKLNGVRIELGEIEAVLRGCEGVTEAVAAAVEQDGRRALVGYVVPAPGATVDVAALREAARAALPEAMVPSAYVTIPEVPLDPNGKVDRRQLPAPGPQARAATPYAPPTSAVEAAMVWVWAQVLGAERVGIDDSFFDLGGDSMLAVTLVGALRAAGQRTTVRDVFAHRTVRRLAKSMTTPDDDKEAARSVAPFSLIGAEDRAALPEGLVDAYPATRAQVGMAVEIAKGGSPSLYHVAESIRVDDGHPLSVEALQDAVDDLVARHETLRTSVHLDGYSVPMQLVHARARVTVHEGPPAERVPFQLDEAPLLRVAAHDDTVTVSASHLITGGWDFNTLLRELVTGYRRRRAGLPAEPDEVPPVRYADFVAAELAALDSAEDRDYWHGVVTGRPGFTLPEALGDPSGTGGNRSTVDIADLDAPLRAFARDAGVSVKSVLHAAHLKVMSQLSREDRFHTGLVCDARPEVRGAERVHGMYINILPFAYDRGAATWRDLVKSVFDREVELWPHRRYPLPAIQRLAGAGPRPIDVVFGYTEARPPAGEESAPQAVAGTTEFGLSVGASSGQVRLVADARTVSREALARLGAMFRRVLGAMVADPDGDARETFLPPGERETILGWAAGPAAPVPHRLAQDAFEARAAERPAAVAVTCEGRHVTYGELNARANRLAHHLRDLGVGPEVLVGVCAERSVEQVAAMLAVHKAGGVYLPLDPGYPADRLAFMLADAGAPVLLTAVDALPAAGLAVSGPRSEAARPDGAGFPRPSASEASAISAVPAARVVRLDEPDAWAGRPDTDPAPLAGPDSGCFVIYTSGSTGRPKGAVLTHEALVNRQALAGPAFYRLDGGSVVLQKTEIGFDVSPGEIYAALSAGARLVVARAGGHRDPAYLCDLMAREGVTAVHFVPAMLPPLLAEGLHRVRSLRAVGVGGEELPADVARAFLAALPWAELHNTYGPAEATVDVSSWPCTPDALARSGRVPLGVPHPNVRLYVLDEHLQPVPAGAPGELCAGGIALGRGYLGAAALTAARWVPDPYGPPGSRLYRTGDAATWRADGTLAFLGRIDGQVKLNGVRVELGEVEAALRGCPGVAEAVAKVVERDGRRALAAYLLPAPGSTVDVAALRERLRAALPEAMVPSAYVMIDELPLSPNGKVDRRQLPDPEVRGSDAHTAPANDIESAVAEVWARVLGLPRVGVDESFFDLGGDSMLAVALVGALRLAGHPTTVRDVFAHRTVRGLAATLAPATAGEAGTVEPFALISADDRAALPAGLTDAYPASRTQLGMLAELAASGDSAVYHSVLAHQVRDGRPFDAAALREAVRVVVGRHETLRTSFHLTGYQVPMQLVHAEVAPLVRVEDGRDAPAQVRAARFAEFVAAERATPFALDRAPLLRVSAHLDTGETWWLTFTVCHAITEGWSVARLLAELLEVYAALAGGRVPAAVEVPPVRYADFIAGELASLASGEDRAYWRSIVDGRAPLALPAGWAEPGAVRVAVTVDVADLEPAVRALASDCGVSVKAVLHAAHLKVLSQLTPERSFVTGLVCDARPELPGADRVHGMYLNTLPFPYDRDARTWRQLVTAVFDREVELWPHRRFPLAEIQRERGQRLLRVMFNYQDFSRAQGGGAAATVVGTAGDGATEFDLSVFAHRGRYELSANPAVLGRAGLERIGAMYRAVLAAMVADPGGDAQAVRLPEGERLDTAEEATVDAPVTGRVHELFEARAAATPDAVAVVAGAVELTYAEVNARANRLAHRLRAAGAGRESVVGVCLDRGADLVPALLGVLKSGAAYLPLDPAQPGERIGYMLADAGARVVVTDGTRLAGFDGHVLAPGGDTDWPDTDPGVPGGADDLVYVIYTSGSTGRPKGVCVSHASVLRLLAATQEHYAADGTDVWALFHSYAFDVSVFELWGALAHGGRLVVVPPQVARVPGDLLDLLVEQEVTMLAQTPTAFRGLVRLAGDGDPRIGRLSLRAVVLAGEKLEVDALRPWIDRVGLARVALVNMYGPTESTVYSTYHRLTRADLTPGTGSRIGKALAGERLYVLDQHGHPAPVGVPGELYVAGAGVTRGYLRRPELTAERFLPDPYGPPGARMYRTGDLVTRLASGAVEYHGRLDNQVKLRGYRIELGEIEAALRALPGVDEAVVLMREDTPGDPRLVGYVVAGGGTGELRRALARTLPDYMVPAVLVPLDRLPLNNSGKLDRAALPAPEAHSDQPFVAPRTPLEARVAAVWARVLGVPAVGVEDGFFDLGGHSIKALVLSSALREAGLDATVADIFTLQTVARLCEALAGRTGPAPAERPVEPFDLVPAGDLARLPGGLTDAYPLSQVQLGMLIEMLADNGQNHYHNVASFAVPDAAPFDLATLRAAVDLVVNRHEILRTSVDLTGFSVPMQLVHRHVEVPVEAYDLRGLAEGERHATVRRHVGLEYRTLFDIGRAPLLRLAAHVESDEAWRLTLTICHAVVEGWSLHALVVEILEAYGALRAGGPAPEREEPPVRFADFVAGELRALRSTVDKEYWQGIVDRHARFALPAAWRPRTAPAEREPHSVTVPFDDLAPRLRALASAARVSLKAVLHAAHLTVLGQLTDEPAFYSGLVCNTRPDAAGSERVYAMSLNTLPFPHDRRARGWTELVRAVHAREVELWPHRRYPAPAIRPAGQGDRLVDVYFSYLDFDEVVGDRVSTGPRLGAASSEFALAVAARPGHVELATDSHVMGRGDAERLGAMYRLVLEAMAADPDGDPRVTHLPAREHHDVVVAWNAAPRKAAPALVPHRIEARAAAAPEAEAAGGLTYAEMDAAANRLAHHLRGRGTGADDVVGVLLDRGAELITTLLAVWKAGAAYLPIDPSYPPARIAGMLADAGAATVVTSTGYAGRFGDGADLVLLDRDAARIAARPDSPPTVDIDPDRLAYVIFTSGSTGRPKGVQVSHRSLANYIDWAVGELIGDRTGGAPLFSSVAFDMVVTPIWAPLVAGQRLWLLPAGAGLDELGSRLAAAGPFSFVKLTPGHLDLLAGQLSPAEAAALTPMLVVGGEALTARTCARWHALAPDAVLLNEYGPTEATVAVTRHPVTGPVEGDVAPIGRPLGGMRAYVLDAELRPVPVGARGQVYLGGVGLARGYAGRPDLTADRFVPDPFGSGQRLYRTGDVGRWLPGGDLDLLGRVDDQVKIRGYRVEPGEIRTVLLEHPEVTDAVVVAAPSAGGPRLVAYHVGGDGLAEHCAQRLPAPLIPSAFVPVERIPLNANGKVDHRALPGAPAAATEYTAPRPGPETTLAGIWADVLGIERVGRHDRFFALGGHSLLVVPVVAAARRAGLPLTLQAAMLDRTLAEAAGTPAKAPARTGPVVPPLEPALARHRVPGAVLAVLRGGELDELRAYGVLAAGAAEPVTPDAVFQVGSVSKLVTTVGALALVRRGHLDLDVDVDRYLRTWRVPGERRVTLRQLLGHTAGLAATGDPDRPVEAMPVPDAVAREDNGHFVAVQHVLEDVTGTPFADLMAELVFGPLGMTGSGFPPDFPLASGRPVALGHHLGGEVVPGGWRVRTDLAAAGLWSTAADLTRIVREIRLAALGGPAGLLDEPLARQMLTAGPDGITALGCRVDRWESEVEFVHRGRMDGYRAVAAGRVREGTGVVLLMNGDGGIEILSLLAAANQRWETA